MGSGMGREGQWWNRRRPAGAPLRGEGSAAGRHGDGLRRDADSHGVGEAEVGGEAVFCGCESRSILPSHGFRAKPGGVKAKCPQCGTGKARRTCPREGNAEICSQCCASLRSIECGDCVHYESTWNYEARRAVSSGVPPEGEFFIEINPEVTAAVNDTLAQAERGHSEKAMATLTGLLRDHPRNHEVAFGIGVVHAFHGEHRKAIEWFDKAIAIYPYSLESYINKAVAHQKMLDIPDCVRAYQKVVGMGDARDLEVAAARSFIADFAATIRRTEGVSLDAYLKAGDHFNHAFALMEGEDWQGALEGFQAAAALNDRSAPCHGNMGLCYGYLGQKAKGMAALDRALELDPEYEPARRNRIALEKMEEGEPLENITFAVVNHGLEGLMKNRG